MKIEVIQGDITKLKVDAIVNAANSSLLGGGGVDGAIHDAAGPELLKECRKFNGCQVGEAVITKGYNLPCKYIIHTPGPVWDGGDYNEPKLLKNSYLNSLKLATENKCGTIAFPCISTGIFGYPPEAAAKIAYNTVKNYSADFPEKVIFITFSKDKYNIYQKLIDTTYQAKGDEML